MDILLRSLELSRDRDESRQKEVPKEVHGVLAVHLKTIKLIHSEVGSSMASLLLAKLTVCRATKSFSFHLGESHLDTKSAICDSLKHFVVELPEMHTDPENNILIEVIISSPLLPGADSTVGKAILHIHDIIHNSPLSGQCELKDPNTGAPYGYIIADWAFCYGNYGYGESFQLTHAKKKPGDYLYLSLFPRLAPPPSRLHHDGLIQNPHPTRQPVFIPFHETATLSVQDSSDEAFAETPKYTPERLMVKMARLHDLCRQMETKGNRRQRLNFLEDHLLCDSGYSQISCTGITARSSKQINDRK